MRTDTPGQPPSGSRPSVGSSRTRNSSPPAIHTGAVHTGYRATKASSSSAMLGIPPLLAPARRVQQGEDQQGRDERGQGHQQAEGHRAAALGQEGRDAE